MIVKIYNNKHVASLRTYYKVHCRYNDKHLESQSHFLQRTRLGWGHTNNHVQFVGVRYLRNPEIPGGCAQE